MAFNKELMPQLSFDEEKKGPRLDVPTSDEFKTELLDFAPYKNTENLHFSFLIAPDLSLNIMTYIDNKTIIPDHPLYDHIVEVAKKMGYKSPEIIAAPTTESIISNTRKQTESRGGFRRPDDGSIYELPKK